MVNVVDVLSAGIKMVDEGTVAQAALLWIAITAPPAGAGLVNDTVAVHGVPPVGRFGTTARACKAGALGRTVSALDAPPSGTVFDWALAG